MVSHVFLIKSGWQTVSHETILVGNPFATTSSDISCLAVSGRLSLSA
jgi:hypothetical protein